MSQKILARQGGVPLLLIFRNSNLVESDEHYCGIFQCLAPFVSR
jgi:hypothetical protein